MDDDDFITEELDFSYSPLNDILDLDREIRLYCGMSLDEYVKLRNEMLKAYDYKLPYNILVNALINRAIINLVSSGLLEIDGFNNENITYRVSKKGEDFLTESPINSFDIANNSFYALTFLKSEKVVD